MLIICYFSQFYLSKTLFYLGIPDMSNKIKNLLQNTSNYHQDKSLNQHKLCLEIIRLNKQSLSVVEKKQKKNLKLVSHLRQDYEVMTFEGYFGMFWEQLQQHIKDLMGNSENYSNKVNLRDFPMQKYLNQCLNQNQILQIKQAFDSYEPSNGEIDLSQLKATTEQSHAKDKIQSYLKNKRTMNFDEFFAMSKEVLVAQINKNPSMIIDTDQVQASCLFCPYSVDKKR